MPQAFHCPCDHRRPLAGRSYRMHWCNGCGFGQVWRRPSKAEVLDFYAIDDYYTHDDHSNHDAGDRLLDRVRLHLAWRLDRGEDLTPDALGSFQTPQQIELLEIGCGDGSNLARLQQYGFRVTGVEPDPRARQLALARGVPVLDGTAEDLPEGLSGRPFDRVLMSHVLEHCLDIDAAIDNALASLRPSGLLVVETPNCDALGFRVQQAAWPWTDIPRHLNFFTPRSLRLLLTRHGLHIVRQSYCGYCRQFSNAWLHSEAQVWRSLQACGARQDPMPHFKARAWMLLLRSMLSPKARKYDSVRLVARRG